MGKNLTSKGSAEDSNQTKHGYFMYADGHSYWGMGLYRNNEIPKECPVEIHKEKDIKKKLEWYNQ